MKRFPAIVKIPVAAMLFFHTVTVHAQVKLQQVPVLCYHQVRNPGPRDSKLLVTSPQHFALQMKTLSDSGYHVILPDQLFNYLTKHTPLPAKPVLLTFDDGTESQETNAVPVLNAYHFKAVFFVMTVGLHHPFYISPQQLKALSDQGFVIGCHTWDHHMVTKYTGNDWVKQIEKPKQALEQITGKPVDYFAYPYGEWNATAVQQLEKDHFKAAFQLTEARTSTDAVYTIRRLMVQDEWNGRQLISAMKGNFR